MDIPFKKVKQLSLGTLALAILAACASVPEFPPPAMAPPSSFKEQIPAGDHPQTELPGTDGSAWTPAQPGERFARGQWWRIFEDSTLGDLIQQAMDANQDLLAAAARLEQARALRGFARSEYFPTVNAGFGPVRSYPSRTTDAGSASPPSTTWTADIGVSYEPDLFGRIRASAKAATADAQESEALYHSVELAVQTDVAASYFLLRQLGEEHRVIRDAVQLRQQGFDLIAIRYREGDLDEVDFSRAKTELTSARSAEAVVERARATAEHALAVLIGKAPSSFNVTVAPFSIKEVEIPVGLPSTLLERRPDITAAERAMAAANARVGVARGAYFPSLVLTGSGGYRSSALSNLFQWGSRTFWLGPVIGTAINLPLFDGGRRKHTLENAKAHYDEDVAGYRQKVLVAFKEVEDGLSSKRTLDDQVRLQQETVSSANRAATLLESRYDEGEAAYLDVIDAQRTALQAQRDLVDLKGQQAVNTVRLIQALGGGWVDSAASEKVAIIP